MSVLAWAGSMLGVAYFGCAGVWGWLVWKDHNDEDLPAYKQLKTVGQSILSGIGWIVILLYAIFETRKKNRPNG